jgi:hypothetical protein
MLTEKIGETEYAGVVDPRYTKPVEFGVFYLRPDFPDRRDANQLYRVQCGRGEVDRLVAAVEDLYTPTHLPFRRLSGYDRATWDHLRIELRDRGWHVAAEAMKVHSECSTRPTNADLEIRSVDPLSPDLEALYTHDGKLDGGFAFARCEFARVGGEYLVGYDNGRPACCTGWYAANGIARFRHVYTAPWARQHGFASTLIEHIQRHPEVLRQEALVIFVGSDGPVSLYEDLGFRTAGVFWSALMLKG